MHAKIKYRIIGCIVMDIVFQIADDVIMMCRPNVLKQIEKYNRIETTDFFPVGMNC